MRVSLADTVILTATCEYRIPVLAEALAVAAFPFPNNPNSLCVPVASVAAKNVAMLATAPENDLLDATFRAVSVPS